MDGPDGVRLHAHIGGTDRGDLWRASRNRPNDRIVRYVDPRFCDERFRTALRAARELRHPSAVQITDEGWSGARYYVEYALDRPMWTLSELLDRCPHWTDRLAVLARLCDTLAQWRQASVPPHAVSRHDIVVTDDAEHAPRILPCPAVTLTSPADLLGTDPDVLAAIAPETVRGVPLTQLAQDRYAFGTVTAQALGCAPTPLARDDAARVETQARGALLLATAPRSAVEPFLRDLPQIRHLFSTIEHYRHPIPDARPPGIGQLRAALTAVTDLPAMAQTLRPNDPRSAVTVLSWVDERDPGRLVACLRTAAEICLEEDDPAGALGHLDRAVGQVPNHFDVRRERSAVLWTLFESAPDDPARLADLLADLEFVAKRSPRRSAGWLLRTAEVYRRLGDRWSEARTLYEAARLDGRNIDTLVHYGRCLTALDRRDDAADVVLLGKQRIPTLVAARLMTEEEGRTWIAALDELLD